MKSMKWTFALLLVAVAATYLAPVDAEAIPAFARRYKMSCTTCHTPFPRLKPFGDEFAANGFYIPEEEKERDYIEAGDDLLHLNRDFPVAVRLDAYAAFNEVTKTDGDTEYRSDMQTPFGVKLLSGGPLARNVGYYFYFYMSEKGEVVGIEDAYLHFNDLGGRPLDILVGQFQVCDPLMKRELRLTYEDYQILKARIGLSENNLAYDRGLVLSYDLAASGTGLMAMIVNGNGMVQAENDRFDQDKYKNFMGRINQEIGSLGSIGYFGYYGEELGGNPDPDGNPLTDDATAGMDNRLLYHGPDVKIGNGTFDLTVQYVLRRDTNPDYLQGAVNVETDGMVAELVISPNQDRSRHYLTLLYNRIDSDWDANDYETYTLGVTRLAARNLRLTAEYTYDAELELSRGALGIVSAF